MHLSALPSASKPLDPMEWAKILTDGEGLSVYGSFTVDNYEEDTAIAESIVNLLGSNLLAEGFDLKQAKYVGYIVAASKEVWDKIPASSINYANSLILDIAASPAGVFKGYYVIDTPDNDVKVYSFFSGLGLPENRVSQLKTETLELQNKLKTKDDGRNLTLQLNTGVSETTSAAKSIKDKIAAKSSTFGKFVSGTIDRRGK
jgi:hypothetical protein